MPRSRSRELRHPRHDPAWLAGRARPRWRLTSPVWPTCSISRLAEATRLGRLDEASLLSIVDAATQLAADSGAVDVAPALSKRLRRHVYEYLLSLDAAWHAVAADARGPGYRIPPTATEMLIGADEVAALGGPELPEAEVMIPGSNGGSHGYPPPSHLAAAETPYPGSGDTRSQPGADTLSGGGAVPLPLERRRQIARRSRCISPRRLVSRRARGGGAREAEQAPASTPPQFSFHIGDPDDLLTSRTPAEGGGPAAGGPEARDPFDAGDTDGLASRYAPPRRRASFSDPSTWPKPVTPTLRGRESHRATASSTPGSRLRRRPPHRRLPDEARFQDLGSWPAARSADPAGPQRLRGPGPLVILVAGSARPRWDRPRPRRYGERPARRPRTSNRPTGHPAPRPARGLARRGRGVAARSPATAPACPPEIPPGWSVRQPEAVELHLPLRRRAPERPRRLPDDDPRERPRRAPRRPSNERLRKKRCDDVAAVLQQAAQELGGAGGRRAGPRRRGSLPDAGQAQRGAQLLPGGVPRRPRLRAAAGAPRRHLHRRPGHRSGGVLPGADRPPHPAARRHPRRAPDLPQDRDHRPLSRRRPGDADARPDHRSDRPMKRSPWRWRRRTHLLPDSDTQVVGLRHTRATSSRRTNRVPHRTRPGLMAARLQQRKASGDPLQQASESDPSRWRHHLCPARGRGRLPRRLQVVVSLGQPGPDRPGGGGVHRPSTPDRS